VKMLVREDYLRLSDEAQALYAKRPESFMWKSKVTNDIQEQVAEEFGFEDNVEEGVDLLRSALSLFPGDQTIINSAFYLRFNINVPCPLKVGEIVPNTPLFTLDGKQKYLHDIVSDSSQPTIIAAGSYT